jgi:hypothetical protein
VERSAAHVLLGEQLASAPMDLAGPGNPWVRLRTMSRDRRRRRELRYLVLRAPAGIVTAMLALAALTAPVAIASAPIQANLQDHPFGEWALSSDMETIASSPWAWLLVPFGALLLVGALHLLDIVGRRCATWARRALG